MGAVVRRVPGFFTLLPQAGPQASRDQATWRERGPATTLWATRRRPAEYGGTTASASPGAAGTFPDAARAALARAVRADNVTQAEQILIDTGSTPQT